MLKYLMAGALAIVPVCAASAADVESKLEVKSDAAALWAKIGGWCAIADFHPVVAKCEESEVGGKKHRTLTTKDGGIIDETMTESGKTSYTYRIDESPLPVEDYTATFAVEPAGSGAQVVWSAKFEPKGASEEDAKKVIKGIFDGGLEGIKAKAK